MRDGELSRPTYYGKRTYWTAKQIDAFFAQLPWRSRIRSDEHSRRHRPRAQFDNSRQYIEEIVGILEMLREAVGKTMRLDTSFEPEPL